MVLNNMHKVAENYVLQLEDLPNELWLKLSIFLPYTDKLQLRLVCRRWRDVISSTKFMDETRITIGKRNLQDINAYLALNNGHLKFTNIELRNLNESEILKTILSKIGGQVQYLKLNESFVFGSINNFMPNLNMLSIDSTNNDSTQKQTIKLKQFINLTGLECDSVSLDEASKLDLLKQLSRQQTTQTKLSHLRFELRSCNEEILLQVFTHHAATLTYLDLYLSHFPNKTLEEWQNVFVKLNHLTTMKLSGVCHREILLAILQSIPKEAPISHIDLTGMLVFNGEMLKIMANKWLSTLHTLKLGFCIQLKDKDFIAMQRLQQHLKVLSIAHCDDLSSCCLFNGLVCATNDVLQELHLNNVKHLDESATCLLAQRLPNLTKLSLINCCNVTDVALSTIFQYQTKLRELLLDNCLCITDKALLGHSKKPFALNRLRDLRILSISGGKNLSNRILQQALRLPELRTLELEYCLKLSSAGFQELAINCPALEKLSVVSCKKVDDLAVAFIAIGLKRLRKLNLSNCINITEQSIDCIAVHCNNLKELIIYGVDALNVENVEQHLYNMMPQLKVVIM